MAGYGGAVKNISIGIASAEGKAHIHSGGTGGSMWSGDHRRGAAERRRDEKAGGADQETAERIRRINTAKRAEAREIFPDFRPSSGYLPDSGQRPSVRGPETFLPPAPVRSVIAAAASGIRTGRDGHGSAGAHVQSSLVAFVESVVESVVPATVVAGIEASLEVGQRRIIIVVVIIAAASAAASIAAPHISFSFYFSCLYYILCGQEGNGSSCHLFPASS